MKKTENKTENHTQDPKKRARLSFSLASLVTLSATAALLCLCAVYMQIMGFLPLACDIIPPRVESVAEPSDASAVSTTATTKTTKTATTTKNAATSATSTTTTTTAETTTTTTATKHTAALVPESAEVDDSYFDDAVILGASRELGLMMAIDTKATFYTAVGQAVTALQSKRNFTDDSVSPAVKRSAFEMMAAHPDFTKVYFSFGINELGWYSPQIFVRSYKSVISAFMETRPDVTVYVMAVLPISATFNESGYVGADGGNARIADFNRCIEEMCDELGINYIDCDKPFTGADGNLPNDYSSDGEHLKNAQYKELYRYLKTHTAGN